MRPLALLLLLLLPSAAGDFRKWTEESTKRVIEGTITDKKSDGSSAKIITKDDRTVWLECAKLVQADRDYVKNWIGSDGRLTVRVTATGRGWKELKVNFQSGASPLEIQAYDQWPRRELGPNRKLKPGEQGEFTYKAHSEYRVIAKSEGQEIDRETDKRKTGL